MGSRYDLGSLAGPPRSHTGAVLQSPGYELAAVVDADAQARQQFLNDWKLPVPVYGSVDKLLEAGHYDVIVIAVTAALHFPILKKCLAARTRLIFCEKPFCGNFTEAAEIVALAQSLSTPVLVNYHRRWDKKMCALKALFDAQNAHPRHIQGRYCKGLHNYGSHLINLLQFFFGSVRSVNANSPSGTGGNSDPSLSFVLEMDGGVQAVISGVNDLEYEFLDLSVCFRDCEYRLGFGGFQIQKFVPYAHPLFPGYTTLQPAESVFPDGLVHGLLPAYQEIRNITENNAHPETNTADSALETHRVMEAIRSSALTQKRVDL